MSKQPAIGISVSATGQTGTGAGYLGAHYAAFRPEYEAMLRAVGIRPGWRVLDAGCGGGDFLPLLAELVGPRGAIVAVDLAEDNVAIARQRVTDRAFPCPVDVREGSITALDFPDAAFDAVWCANTLMYLTAEETATALTEFRRVTRPGGLVANKEIEAGLHLLAPAPPFLLARLWARRIEHAAFARGLVRARGLRALQRRAGLEATWQRTTLIERWSPLEPSAHAFLGQTLGAFARWEDGPDVSADAQATWQRLRDADAPDYLLDDPDFYYCEAASVAVGRVPGDGG